MGCTREGPHYGCEDGALSLVFTHEGSTANFDRSVADDIELYLYHYSWSGNTTPRIMAISLYAIYKSTSCVLTSH